MHIRTLATLFFVLALPALANAQTWTSADGFLEITPPDASAFQAMSAPPPPFVGLWVSTCMEIAPHAVALGGQGTGEQCRDPQRQSRADVKWTILLRRPATGAVLWATD
ncbi:hypothetical protein K227x_62060 [Rubripirellula lacrimiformis]|uniref:Alkaline proteinase inhibitor/ Outer membrane lipoprotein Omp19 domain-containing protein n=1 Tax=Rubripirellula lacrimiformis TaxID=1930273 RepID=A0A517NKV8_9BACT|nr:hypothetical protein K227x_62060 [Rubripirellula lacrimiformis]